MEPVPQKPELFALAEPELECTQKPDPMSDPDSTLSGMTKLKKAKLSKKLDESFLGNNAASDIKKAKFFTKFSFEKRS